MRAAVYQEPFVIEIVERPAPVIRDATDAVVRVTAACVCGSDLWYYRGLSPRQHGQTIGHEFIGVVEEIGSDVTALRVGDFVIAPFMWNDGDCPHCRFGAPTSCTRGGIWGAPGADGGQGEAVRVPFADATLVVVPGGNPAPDSVPSLLALADVMGTGHHAALSANVVAGGTVAVVGDGAVGLCGVIAAKRLGAERIIALSRNPRRQELALRFGATEVVAERGADAAAALLDLTDGIGIDSVLECVGTGESMTTAFDIVRPGGSIGYVGVPHGIEFPVHRMFPRNVGVRGGLAPARRYLPELLADVLAGAIEPGAVFDSTVALEDLAEGYRRMDARESVKVLVTV
jgi:threonine dehydrogenase-like Zn-dependent dehydrogenase